MKDILVSIDGSKSDKTSIDAALCLAEKFDSHITCIYEEKLYDYSSYADLYADVIAAAFDKQLFEENAAITRQFNDSMRSRKNKSTLKIEKSLDNKIILAYSYIHDIIVCAQHDTEKSTFGDRNLPEHLVMGSGKPVLIIPYVGFPETLGKNIIVAWDKSREASRALHDALPLLMQAEKVHIFSAIRKDEDKNEIAAVADVAEHLSRHSVNVENSTCIVDHDISVAEMLLSRASDYGADLIVMGAYGHSRLREYTLGGTTRTILNSMTIPVLMTH